MTQFEKLVAKFISNPSSLRFSQIHKILIKFGFELTKINGSHHLYQNIALPYDLSIPVHNGDCKNIYKQQAAEIIKKLSN